MAERLVNEDEKYELIIDASVVFGMEKRIAFDGEQGIMVKFKTGAAKQETQEGQWPSPTQQQQQDQQK